MTYKLIELGPLHSQLPFAFNETTTKLQCFYKDIPDHYAPISEALAKRASLVEATKKVLIDLFSLNEKKLELIQFYVKTKIGLDEVEKKCKKLEKEINLLAKKVAKLNTAK